MTDHNPAEPDCPLNEPCTAALSEGVHDWQQDGSCADCSCQCALIAKVLRRGVESVESQQGAGVAGLIAAIDAVHAVMECEGEYACEKCHKDGGRWASDPVNRCMTIRATKPFRAALPIQGPGLFAEVQRAKERSDALPDRAKPVVTRGSFSTPPPVQGPVASDE